MYVYVCICVCVTRKVQLKCSSISTILYYYFPSLRRVPADEIHFVCVLIPFCTRCLLATCLFATVKCKRTYILFYFNIFLNFLQSCLHTYTCCCEYIFIYIIYIVNIYLIIAQMPLRDSISPAKVLSTACKHQCCKDNYIYTYLHTYELIYKYIYIYLHVYVYTLSTLLHRCVAAVFLSLLSMHCHSQPNIP